MPESKAEKSIFSELKLPDLVNVSVLQDIQDWFVGMTGVESIIRDESGEAITKPSAMNDFCSLVFGCAKGGERCRESNRRSVSMAAERGKPEQYICHAGLTQYAAPIIVDGRCFGTIVIGSNPREALDRDDVKNLAEEIDADSDTLINAASDLELWSDEKMRSAVTFLHTTARAIAEHCYQSCCLEHKNRELSTLYEVSKLLTSTLDLQEVLDLIVKTTAEVLDVRACSLRLLDKQTKELVIKAVYNLSQAYLNKGPIMVERSEIDRRAMLGEVISISDLTSDPRVLYPREAEKEGICSSLCVGLISRDEPIGAIHIYTSEPHEFSQEETTFFRSLANQAAVAIENAKLHQEIIEKEKLERELELAGEIQARLIPDEHPSVAGFDISGKTVPCRQVGGDFYDFIHIDDDHIAIVIADISGKGVPGAILMATARAALRAQVERGLTSTMEIISRVNATLCRDTGSGEFVTLFLAVLNIPEQTLTYTNAGHNPPLLFQSNCESFLDGSDMLLGVDGDAVFSEVSITLRDGDALLLYTDGVPDAMDKSEEMFTKERLQAAAKQSFERTSHEIVDAVHQAVLEFAGDAPQNDDITIVVLKSEVNGGGKGASAD